MITLVLVIYCVISFVFGFIFWMCGAMGKIADDRTEKILRRERKDK